MPLRSLIGLILCNLVWSANPAMAKLILADCTPAQTAWLRYASALAGYFAAMAALRLRSRTAPQAPLVMFPRSGREAFFVFVMGFMSFCFAPMLQFAGLQDSRATDNALIVAMEPLLTVFLARVFLKERLSGLHWLAFGVALTGFGMLTDLAPSEWSSSGAVTAHQIGNLLILVALLGEASYSVAARKLLARKNDPVSIFGAALVVGVSLLTLAAIGRDGTSFFHLFSHFTWRSGLAVFWLGPVGTALTYFYWMLVLVEAPVATLALTLFIQPVCGAVWGYFLLGERLSELQAFGAVLILGAVILQVGATRSEPVAVVSAQQ